MNEALSENYQVLLSYLNENLGENNYLIDKKKIVIKIGVLFSTVGEIVALGCKAFNLSSDLTKCLVSFEKGTYGRKGYVLILDFEPNGGFKKQIINDKV